MNNGSKPTILYSSDPGADEALVSAAKNGNQRAFEVLVERHQQRMLVFARRYTRVREDAEDVVQNLPKGLYPLEQISREIFLFDLVNTDRYQRSPYVGASRSCAARDNRPRFKRPRSRCVSNGDT